MTQRKKRRMTSRNIYCFCFHAKNNAEDVFLIDIETRMCLPEVVGIGRGGKWEKRLMGKTFQVDRRDVPSSCTTE